MAGKFMAWGGVEGALVERGPKQCRLILGAKQVADRRTKVLTPFA